MMSCGYYTLPVEVKLPENDPIKKIEDVNAMQGFGQMAYHVYKGAIDEGATKMEAYLVTAAYFRGMFGGSSDNPQDNEETP